MSYIALKIRWRVIEVRVSCYILCYVMLFYSSLGRLGKAALSVKDGDKTISLAVKK